MSSHATVRDKQEPALLILNDEQISEELIGQLLEWNPVVFVKDTCLLSFSQRHIKTDVIFRTELNEDFIDSLTHSQHVELINNCRALQEMLVHISAQDFSAVNIIGANEDDCRQVLNATTGLDLVFYTNEYKMYPMLHDFSKWMTKGMRVEIKSDKQLKYNGLSYLPDKSLEVIKDGLVSIKYPGENAFLIEYF